MFVMLRSVIHDELSLSLDKDSIVIETVLFSISSDYIDELMVSLMAKREQNNSYVKARKSNSLLQQEIPIPIAQSTPRARKRDVVSAHRARFNC